jgi:hypothetical protein
MVRMKGLRLAYPAHLDGQRQRAEELERLLDVLDFSDVLEDLYAARTN